MAKKVYVQNNFLYIVDTIDGKVIEALAKDCIITTSTLDSTEFYFKGTNSDFEVRPLAFADIQDEAGNPYADIATFRAWYTGALGDGSSGGGSSPNPDGITSVVNSTTNPLLAGQIFTGVGESNTYPDVMVQVATDQNGILYVEFSPDGVNWDTSLSFNYDTDRINPPHVFVKSNRYFRVRFDNNSGFSQTYLRLYVYYGQFGKLTAPINGKLAENYDAIVTRPTDYDSEVALGKRQGTTTVNKFGFNNAINTGSDELMAPWGGIFIPSITAETVEFVSSSAADSSAGTGLQQVLVTGIGDGRIGQTEIITLDGVSTVTSSLTWLGINRISPLMCGSGQRNDGLIEASGTNSGEILAQLPVGKTITQQCIFYVQKDHTFLFTGIHINILKLTGGTAPKVRITGWVFSPNENAFIDIFDEKIDTSVKNSLELKNPEPFPIGENSVFYFTATTDTAGTEASLRFSGKEVRNN